MQFSAQVQLVATCKSVWPGFTCKRVVNFKYSQCSSPFPAEHTCSIIMWLFRNLSGNLRTRLVQKFVENDHLKVDRLMELHIKYHNKIQDCDAKIEKEKQVGCWVLQEFIY